jgi:hypothetical protein
MIDVALSLWPRLTFKEPTHSFRSCYVGTLTTVHSSPNPLRSLLSHSCLTMSYQSQPTRSDSVRSSNRSSATSESLLQKISKRASFPHRALTRTRSLLHRTQSVKESSNKKTKVDEDAQSPHLNNSARARDSWHGL